MGIPTRRYLITALILLAMATLAACAAPTSSASSSPPSDAASGTSAPAETPDQLTDRLVSKCSNAHEPACKDLWKRLKLERGLRESLMVAVAHERAQCAEARTMHYDECKSFVLRLAYGLGEAATRGVARAFLREECANNKPGACYLVARHRITGELFEREPQRGLMWLAKSCAEKAGNCLTVPVFFDHADFEVDDQEFAKMMGQGCDNGDFVACMFTIRLYGKIVTTEGISTKALARRVRLHFQSWDDEEPGTMPDHSISPEYLIRLPAGAFAEVQLEPFFLKHCEAGQKSMCLWLARFERAGVGLSKNIESAKRRYRQLCDNSYEPACADLDELERLEAIDEPLKLETTCNRGDAEACLLAGVARHYGGTKPERFAEAAKFYKRACDLNEARGCQRVDQAKGELQPPQRGHQKWDESLKVCRTKGADECFKRGRATTWHTSFKKGIHLVQLACKKGHPQACEYLERRRFPSD